MNITIIDDDAAIGFSLRIALEDRGHDVIVYNDPTQVPYGSLRTDVVLLDYYMPKLNGEQVLERLRAQPTLKSVKVILMSAFPNMRNRAEQMRVRLLPKPFDLGALYQVIEE